MRPSRFVAHTVHPARATFLACLIAMSLSACGPARSRMPVPAELVASATIPGMPHVRTWGDAVDEQYIRSMSESVLQEEAYYAAHPHLTMPASTDILLISGGGENGAFGAGILNGWTAAGDRPDFKLVTGVSTGALIAPFAFLGPEYDHVLREVYTETSADKILDPRGILAILTHDSLADTEPLARLIDQYIDADFLAKVAAEHARGRRLLIASVNLEAQRPIIWDLGAIATIGTPEAEQLFQTVMLASASIPGAFPPQYIEVEAGGKRYDEMHVDGGTMAQSFLWGAGFSGSVARQTLGRTQAGRPGNMYIIRNGKFNPERKELRALFVDIAGRAVSTLIKTQSVGDMFRLSAAAQRENATFNYAFIPESFDLELKKPFDTNYMRALYELGYDQASEGYPWHHKPPYLDAHWADEGQ